MKVDVSIIAEICLSQLQVSSLDTKSFMDGFLSSHTERIQKQALSQINRHFLEVLEFLKKLFGLLYISIYDLEQFH